MKNLKILNNRLKKDFNYEYFFKFNLNIYLKIHQGILKCIWASIFVYISWVDTDMSRNANRLFLIMINECLLYAIIDRETNILQRPLNAVDSKFSQCPAVTCQHSLQAQRLHFLQNNNNNNETYRRRFCSRDRGTATRWPSQRRNRLPRARSRLSCPRSPDHPWWRLPRPEDFSIPL